MARPLQGIGGQDFGGVEIAVAKIHTMRIAVFIGDVVFAQQVLTNANLGGIGHNRDIDVAFLGRGQNRIHKGFRRRTQARQALVRPHRARNIQHQ